MQFLHERPHVEVIPSVVCRGKTNAKCVGNIIPTVWKAFLRHEGGFLENLVVPQNE